MQTELTSLLQQAGNFHPVVPFEPGHDHLLQLDFTDANTALTTEIIADTQAFTEWINKQLHAHDARYGIGGYAEHRTIYNRSTVFDSPGGEEPRRLHLGIDIWGAPRTAVMAPLDGIVHSFAFNDRFGDYGATIILTHRVNERSFHSLYGHLSLNSIRNLSEGQRIEKGEHFAEFGVQLENGQWPPHLHFQLIADLQDHKGDYPGVCRFSEREQWLSNCPDPDLVLGMMKYAEK